MLDNVLNARSVAIVGASKNKTKRGFQAIKTLQREGFEGEIYPINPKEDMISGLKCYKNITDIDGAVDLALITTPARTIPDILQQCGEKNVAGAVIIAGGFRELGDKGRALEEKMVKTARETGVRLIGPNTSGIINLKTHMNLAGIPNVPGGKIERGEAPEAAIEREIFEETKITAKVTRLLDVWLDPNPESGTPFGVLWFELIPLNGKVMASSDLTDAKWVPIKKVLQVLDKEAINLFPRRVKEYFS